MLISVFSCLFQSLISSFSESTSARLGLRLVNPEPALVNVPVLLASSFPRRAAGQPVQTFGAILGLTPCLRPASLKTK